jgi:glyoxalase family protein
VPGESLGWWQRRLKDLGVEADEPFSRSDEDVLRLRDPDGLVVELVASDGDHRSGWDGAAGISPDQAIRGLHSVTMTDRQLDPTAGMLGGKLGMHFGPDQADRTRFTMADGKAGTFVDVAADRGPAASCCGVRTSGCRARNSRRSCSCTGPAATSTTSSASAINWLPAPPYCLREAQCRSTA